VRFAKLHGAGNDFLVFDGGVEAGLESSLPPAVAALCHRRFGLGADGVLLLLPGAAREARLVYWNADGSTASFCANGTRCAARFAAERWGWDELLLHTGYAPIPARVRGVQVTLELPAATELSAWRSLATAEGDYRARRLVVGVPHLVVPVDWPDFWDRPLAPLAPALRAHGDLPAGGANVNFVRVEPGSELAVRSWERGVEGETLSCGSGDVAVALVGIAEGWCRAPSTVRTASGRRLVVGPRGEPPACPSTLAGPAEWVADGDVSPELLRR
jgi:diaminopimelate epimerase